MSITYTFDPETRILRTRCAGRVTLEETLEHFQQVWSDPNVPARCKALLDVSSIEALPPSDQLRSAAGALDARAKRAPRGGPWAIVAGRDAMYGMSRMFQVFLEEANIESRVFRTEAEADLWLASVDEPAD